MHDHDELALELHDALANRRPVDPLSTRHPDLSVADAYKIQQAGLARRVADGAVRVGRKVGLTSEAMQTMLGVRQPDYGVVLNTMVVGAEEGIDATALIAPRIEVEIAFLIERPLKGPNVTREHVLAATSRVAPALEVIDSRIADWQITIVDTVADNASSGLVILGESRALADVDVVAERATLRVGSREVSGSGAAVLGHPAEAIAWLARALDPHGDGIAAGEFVIPGAVAAALPIAPRDHIRAEFSTLGTLETTVR